MGQHAAVADARWSAGDAPRARRTARPRPSPHAQHRTGSPCSLGSPVTSSSGSLRHRPRGLGLSSGLYFREETPLGGLLGRIPHRTGGLRRLRLPGHRGRTWGTPLYLSREIGGAKVRLRSARVHADRRAYIPKQSIAADFHRRGRPPNRA